MASHGTFASGIKSALDILLGKSDNLTVINAYLNQDNFEEQLAAFFKDIPDTEQVVMLSDLYGGSINQKMFAYLTRPETYLIAGINLALVLDLVLKTESVDMEKLKAIVKESREALRLVEIQTKRVQDNDFFGGS